MSKIFKLNVKMTKVMIKIKKNKNKFTDVKGSEMNELLLWQSNS